MPLAKHTYSKMNQDLAKNKYSSDIYYEGRNIRLVTNDSFGTVTNEKGNELVLTIPDITTNPTSKTHLDFLSYPINDLSIIGHTVIDNKLILFLIGNDNIFTIYKVDKEYNVQLIFIDQVEVNYPLDIKSFYENENVQKVYWADGVHELRFLNVADDVINLDKKFISSVPDVVLNTPKITGYISSGSHTSGIIQYAYNLYNLNGSQTKISSLSSLLPLNNNDNGDSINSEVNKSPIVEVNNIDQSFEFIRLYSIKYSSLNATPEIKVLIDQPVGNNIKFIDDNNSSINEITFAEFTFLGGDIFIPKHLAIKDNHLFLANYKTIPFDVDFDTRAYSVDEFGIGKLLDKDGNETLFSTTSIPDLPETHDAINPTIKAEEDGVDYNKYIYNGIDELGGTGPNVKYSILYKTKFTNTGSPSMTSDPNLANDSEPFKLLSLKSGETYRLGLQFQNSKGQWSFPKWMADVRIPEIGMSEASVTNTQINYSYVRVELLNQPIEQDIVSWRIVQVERTEIDKTVITQGFINPTIKDNKSPNFTLYPSYLTRLFKAAPDPNSYTNPITTTGGSQDPKNYARPVRYNYSESDNEYSLSSNVDSGADKEFKKEILSGLDDYMLNNTFNCFYSPEIIKNKSNLGIGIGDKIRYLGFVKNTNSRSSRELYGRDGLLITNQQPQYNTNTWSVTETHDADTLIMQLAYGPPPDNDAVAIRDRIATFKLFGAQNHLYGSEDPEGTDTDHLYTRRKQSFVRYFSGFTHINSDFINRVDPIQSNIPYLAPIDGARSVTLSTQLVNYDANIKILTKINEGNTYNYKPVLYKAYGGSCILLEIENIESKFPNVIGEVGGMLPIVEIIRNVENQYGGNTYEARQRNKYIAYSDVNDINNASIDGYMGDTYIQKFNFLKTFRSDDDKVTISEIVSVPLESSVNLDLRYDILKDRPDNKEADENTSYGFNDVYQQKNNTIKQIAKPSNFQELTNFAMDVIPSKLKFSGELIDSFTDFLINDRKTLEGKYGPITSLFEFNDEIYSFQKNAIAYLAINPRVQISASDGIPIELGSGRLIERYKYLTTTSGSVNKESIIKTNNGIMYFDLLNSSLNFLNGQNEQAVSTLNGMYNKILNYVNDNKSDLSEDIVLDNKGVISYFDNNRKDIYVTFLSNTEKMTLSYNGLNQGFISIVDFTPNMYVNFDNILLTSQDKLTLWEHNIGKHSTYYNIYYPSHVIIVFNENPDIPKITNNIHYNSHFTISGVDQPNITFNNLRVWNDFQDTGERLIKIDKVNAGKKHRRFNFIIPRVQNSRDRIYNHWSYIKLEFDKRLLDSPLSENDYKLVLHDLLVSYSII